MIVASFFVPGVPQPGGSKRYKGHYNKRCADGSVRSIPLLEDDCEGNEFWCDLVAIHAKQAYSEELLNGAVWFTFIFFVPRPKGHYGKGRNAGKLKPSAPKYPTVKPDTTKLVRSTEDALSDVVWTDDARVCDQIAKKRYADDTPVGVQIYVGTMG